MTIEGITKTKLLVLLVVVGVGVVVVEKVVFCSSIFLTMQGLSERIKRQRKWVARGG